MPGLLDDFSAFAATPGGQGLLAATFGGLAGARSGAPLNSLGRAGLAGLNGYSGAIDRQQQLAEAEQTKRLREMQMSQTQLQLDAAKSAEEKRKWMESLAQKYAIPATPALTVPQEPLNIKGDTGPNLFSTNVSNMSTDSVQAAKPASFNFQGYAQELASKDPLEALKWNQMLQKDETPITLKEGETLLDRKTFKPILNLPKKEAAPAAVKEYEYAVSQGYKGSFEQFQLTQKRAGAATTNISMSDGQKGFDNEMKLGGAFKQEPIYKDHSAMQGAFQQIKASLAQGTPISDTAAATKIMKLLDPGSVVRESELGMAMAAGGRMDRLREYVSQSMNGTKLTPTQRQDFLALATELTAASAQAYNSKRSEYRDQGSEYGLNADRALGKPAEVPAIRKDSGNPELTVVAPNGKTYTFKDQKALANWKMATGVK